MSLGSSRIPGTRDEPNSMTSVPEATVKPTSFPGSLSPRPQEREKRDPGCGWSRDLGDKPKPQGGLFLNNCRLSIDKSSLSRPSLQRIFCHHPNSGWHVTSRNQGLSSLALGGGERETLGTRLLSNKSTTKNRLVCGNDGPTKFDPI